MMPAGSAELSTNGKRKRQACERKQTSGNLTSTTLAIAIARWQSQCPGRHLSHQTPANVSFSSIMRNTRLPSTPQHFLQPSTLPTQRAAIPTTSGRSGNWQTSTPQNYTGLLPHPTLYRRVHSSARLLSGGSEKLSDNNCVARAGTRMGDGCLKAGKMAGYRGST